MPDRYSKLTDEEWLYVCETLAFDIRLAEHKGVHFLAHESDEPSVFFELEADGMRWLPNGYDTPLSNAIINDNRHTDTREIESIIEGLALTIMKLKAYVAWRHK